jgi:hypothetical protein
MPYSCCNYILGTLHGLGSTTSDEAQYIVTNNSSKDARYVVPARRQKYIEHAKVNDITGDGDDATSICTGDIVAPQEIKPTFRTPCRFLMVGTTAIKI